MLITMKLRRILAVLCLAVLLPEHMVTAQESTASFIVNGDFADVQESGWPAGWQRRGEVGEGQIVRVREEGQTFIRLVAEQPDQLVGFVQSMPIPPGVLGLDFYARFRTANVKFGKSFLCDARARFGFYDAEGNPVKGPGDVIFDSHAGDWTDISRSFAVPAGAASVNLMLCLNRPASGTLDIQGVRLSAMDAGGT